jgi:hypothetical protein
MAAPKPEIRGFGKSKSNIREIKDKLLRPALTSHFLCQFTPPDAVVKFIRTRIEDSGIPSIDYPIPNDQDLITLSCSEASLPGSSLATIDIDNDFPGVSEKHAYRRLYDDRADFTFYIDSDYKIITFFENWIAYCSGEANLAEQRTREFSYRANYPNNYKTNNLYITKFERDLNFGGRFLQYEFINAYPISISSMPVSYDTSQLLKCNVSFFYSRYVISGPKSPAKNVAVPNSNSPGNSELRRTTPNLGIINDFDGRTFPLGPGIPGLTGISNPGLA